MSINKVILIGRLGKDPEISETTNGKKVCKFSIATNVDDKTEWHNIVVWEKLAELCVKYLIKGKQVYVEGSLSYSSWDDGKKKGVSITAQKVSFL